MRRGACGACGDSRLRLVLDLGASPVADAYTTTATESFLVDRHPLQVAMCAGCGLVQLLDVLPAEVLFGVDYAFYASASPPLSAYHKQYAVEVLRHGGAGAGFFVEIGCNDGDLLRHFAAAGRRTLGVDPSGGPVDVARRRGLDVVNEPFSLKTAERIVDEHGHADIVIANHVLAHVPDVDDMVAGIAYLLADDGRAYIEVQYLPDLVLNNAIDLVYHEHRNFFHLGPLAAAFARHGLATASAITTDRQGGSLRAVFARRPWQSATVELVAAGERWLTVPGALGDLQARADRLRERMLEALHERSIDGRRVVGYGAPAKATTLLNWCGLTARSIAAVVDSTSAKQGRYVPGAGIPIVAPDAEPLNHGEAVLLLAWNYAGPIIRNNPQVHSGGGRWIVPIPAPVVI